jgi:hypothetical protein
MTDTFSGNPDFVIAEPPVKPVPKPRPTPKIYNHPCAKCEAAVNNQAPRIVITTFDRANTRATNYYHERCSPLKPAGAFDKVKGLFGL